MLSNCYPTADKFVNEMLVELTTSPLKLLSKRAIEHCKQKQKYPGNSEVR